MPVDFDPYADGTLTFIDNGGSANHLSDTPTFETNIRIKLRGNSSMTYNKHQYLIKMINEDGTKNRQDILGMGSDWEWILNISYIDKSLLRNYLCFNIAGEIMPYTPEVRFCEVFFRNGDDYGYQGLYLLMESVKQGAGRVNIAEYDSHFAESSYILCRDRYSETGLMLDNYGTRNNITYGYLDVRHPSQNEITDVTLRYIEEDIDRLEKALFSDDVNEFLLYRNYIDTKSFIDYFIINEFFSNYDAGYNSFYMYKDITGKLFLGPVWDFDQAIDNNYPEILKLDSTAMHDGMWFRQLLRDADFAYQLIQRYHELRQGILSDGYLENYIDETIAFLGPALERDWDCWQYNNLTDLLTAGVYQRVPESLLVNTRRYSEEIDHMKLTLREHGAWLDENIDSLYQFSEFALGTLRETAADPAMNFIFGKEKERWAGGIAAILVKIGFVQTPQSFYNADMFQFNLFAENNVPNEQDYFFREINVGRNRTNSVVYAGSNTVIFREALDAVGGIQTGTITEDFATGLNIQGKGYTCYAIDKAVAHGLAPKDFKSLIKQRQRWARGCVQTLMNLNFLFGPLPLRAKASYMICFLYWWTFLRRLIYILSPILFVVGFPAFR